MQPTLAVVDDPLFEEHRAPTDHPERPERLGAARTALERAGSDATVERLAPRDASDEELERVHASSYVSLLSKTSGKRGYFDPDTYFAPSSANAARRAAGGALALTDALLDGQADHGVALLRPPGHHARPGGAMGFCLLNNVAVAAAHARARGAQRVMIVDWDVHHGNGTQEMFYDDPSVLYVSTHQWPFYPGTGAVDEVGEGEGRGYTVNVPLGAGAEDGTYTAAFERIIAPITRAFDPDLLLVSAGFDAHDRDPLAGMHVSEEGYANLLALLATALPRGPKGRVGLVLEGGYDLVGLERSLDRVLAAAATGAAPTSMGSPGNRHERELAACLEMQRECWGAGVL